MACNFPMSRLSIEGNERLFKSIGIPLKRAINGGVIFSRAEYNSICALHPFMKNVFQEVPCGKCIACRLERSRQWAMRIMNEARFYESSLFITLTYNNDNLPFAPFYNVESGELEQRPALVPEHLKKFMKDLRRYFDYHYGHQGIRFFGCGEFGDSYARPHFHVILFNCFFDDQKHWFSRKVDGRTVWTDTSEILSKIWKKGITTVSDVTYESASYVARYCLKKQIGKNVKKQRVEQRFVLLDEEDYDLIEDNHILDCDWVHEFTRSSRRPGIGRNYYEEHKQEMYSTDEMFVSTKDGVLSVKPCKYYDKLYDVECPEDFAQIKEKRVLSARNNQKDRARRTDLTEEKMRLNNEERLKRALEKLPRQLADKP